MATTKTTTTKKRGPGRPRKEQPKEHEGWGGKREGAGRKARGATAPLIGHVTFRTTGMTVSRVQALREATKQDEMPFNRMFEAWVEDYAKQYGIE